MCSYLHKKFYFFLQKVGVTSGYDMMMRHGLVSLMQPGDFIYFSLYALSGLVPPLSSFLMQLEHYGLQLLQDVHGGAAIGMTVPTLPHVACHEHEPTTHW
jgi:hypothetical protein